MVQGSPAVTAVSKIFIMIMCLRLPAAALPAKEKADEDRVPIFDFTIKPVTMAEANFEMEGTIAFCRKDETRVKFLLPGRSTFTFTLGGKPADPDDPEGLVWKCGENGGEGDLLHFKGESRPARKCSASGEEIYCLNNSAPNPEIYADAAKYNLKFVLPEAYGALAPEKEIELKTGIQFQIAVFGEPRVHKTRAMTFVYTFPKGFSPEEKYLEFIHGTFSHYADIFGKLPFGELKIGAIRREEERGTISGAPSGNLILFSRTALRDQPKLALPPEMGITRDIADPMRKLIIAHELSHFWFGDRYLGRDGWMVEGIPQYLGLYEVLKDSRENFSDLMKFFEYIARQAPAGEIPNSGLNAPDGYIKAYYSAPVALVKIGNEIGHDKLLELLKTVFSKDPDPSFPDFTEEFSGRYPEKLTLWKTAWQLK